MGHEELARQNAGLISRVQELAEERDGLTRSPAMLVGTQLRSALSDIRNGLLTLINLPRTARAAPADDQDMIATTHFSVQSQYIYQLTASVTSTRVAAKACILRIHYVDDEGSTIGFEEQGANLSLRYGFYHYLPATPAGTPFTLDISPPDNASGAVITVNKWDQKLHDLKLQNLHLKQEELVEDLQCAQFIEELNVISKRHLKRIVIHQTLGDANGAAKDVDILLENNDLVILVCFQPSQLPIKVANPGKVVAFSQRIFASNYKKVAMLQAEQLTYRLDDANYHSILQANYFRYQGWTVSFDDKNKFEVEPSAKRDYLASISGYSNGE